MTKSSCSHPSLFYFESKWICHWENMTPTVATSPKQGEIVIACKEGISPDWNMMSHYRLSEAGMTLDPMRWGREIRDTDFNSAVPARRAWRQSYSQGNALGKQWKQEKVWGWGSGYSSGVEYLPSMHEALGSIPASYTSKPGNPSIQLILELKW